MPDKLECRKRVWVPRIWGMELAFGAVVNILTLGNDVVGIAGHASFNTSVTADSADASSKVWSNML